MWRKVWLWGGAEWGPHEGLDACIEKKVGICGSWCTGGVDILCQWKSCLKTKKEMSDVGCLGKPTSTSVGRVIG